MKLNITDLLNEKNNDTDIGDDIAIPKNTEININKVDADNIGTDTPDPKNSISYYDDELLRLYDVFQDKPNIVTNWWQRSLKKEGTSISYSQAVKEGASEADLNRFKILNLSQRAMKQSSGFLPSGLAQVLISNQEEKELKAGTTDISYPNFNYDEQKKDNEYYDVTKRSRPLDTVDMPWYQKRGLSFAEGVTKGGLGVVELASLGLDYTFDTDYLTEVQKLTDTVNIESNSFLDNVFDVGGQFAVPFGIANKLVTSIKSVNAFKRGETVSSALVKLGVTDKIVTMPWSKIPFLKLADGTSSISKIASRGVYYGSLAGGVDAMVATDTNHTFGDYLGVQSLSKESLEGLSGKARAGAHFRNKLRFGVEGTLAFGAVSTVAKPAIKITFAGGGKLLGGTIKLADTVLTPARKILSTDLIVGGTTKKTWSFKGGPYTTTRKKLFSLDTPFKFTIKPGDNFKKIKESLNKFFNDKQVVEGGRRFGFPAMYRTLDNGLEIVSNFMKKKGVPSFEDWAALNTSKYNTLSNLRKGISDTFGLFTSSQFMPRVLFTAKQRAATKARAKIQRAGTIFGDIERTVNNLVNNETFHKYKGATTSYKFVNILEDITKYFDGEKHFKWINSLPKEIRADVLKLKKLIETYDAEIKTYSKQGGDVPVPSGKMVIRDIKDFLMDNYRLFNDPTYYPSKKNVKKLTAYIKTALQREELRAMKTSYGSDSITLAELTEGSFLSRYIFRNKNKLTPKRKNEIAIEANTIANKIINHFKFDKNIGVGMKRGFEEVSQILSDYGVIKPGTVFTPRNLLPVFKNIFGKINDPKQKYIETLSKMAHSVETYKAHEAMYRLGKNKWFFDNEIEMNAAFAKRNVSSNPVQIKLNSNAHDLNPILNGKWTTEAIVNGLGKTTLLTESLIAIPLYKLFLGSKAISEMSKTVLSQMTHMRNLNFNAFIALKNGHFGENASLFDSFEAVVRDLTGRTNKSRKMIVDELNDEFRRNGINNTNIHTRQFEMLLEKTLDGTIQDSHQFWRYLTDNKFIKTSTKVYSAEDNIWKQYGYLFNKSILDRALKTTKDFQNYSREIFGEELDIYVNSETKKTRGQLIEELSAREIVDVYPNYDMVGRLFQELRLVPIVGNFISFPAEISRNSIKSTIFDIRRIKSSNPYIREQGYRGVMGTLALVGIYGTGTRVAYELAGMNEEQYDLLNEFAAPWDYNANKMMTSSPVVGIAEDGTVIFNKEKLHYSFANSNYHIPQGFLIAPINAMINSTLNGESKSTSQIFYDAFIGTREKPGSLKVLVDPFLTESIIGERYNDLISRQGKTRAGKVILSPTDTPEDQFTKALAHIVSAIEPGSLNSYERLIAGGEGNKINRGPLIWQHELLKTLTGIGITTIDIKKSFEYEISSRGRVFKEARANFYRTAGKNYVGAFVGLGGAPVTRDDRTEAYFKYQLAKYKATSEFEYSSYAANGLGLDYDMQDELLRPDGKPKSGLTNDEIDGILDGYFVPAKELSDDEGSFAQRFADDFGGVAEDHFDFNAMSRIYNFFDQDFELGHNPDDIERLYNGEITKLPTLNKNQDATEGVLEDEEEYNEMPEINLNFSNNQQPLNIPIVQPQTIAAAAPPPVNPAINPATGLSATEEALLSPSEKAIRLRNKTRTVV